jgi:tricorn protease interacting factor F2/3
MQTFQISTYHIQIEPDLDRFIFSGLAEIIIHPSQPIKVVRLNTLELSINHCSVHVNAHQQVCTYHLDSSAETLLIELPEPLTDKFRLMIHYKGTINEKMAGFYRSSFLTKTGKKYLAVTQFQESSARMAFPCLDHPKYKSRFKIELIVDDHLTAVSNTQAKEIHQLANAKKRVCFYPTPIMSTYLVFFGVGRFDYKRDDKDSRLGVITTPGLLTYGRFGLEFGRKALKFCENYYGIDYPLNKMDLLAIPDFAFGAMENWGAITFRENLLLDFPGITSQSDRLRICEVIAHEIAHQWFGNLVTPSDWKYLWLNESFATYFGFGVVDHFYPQYQLWQQFIYYQTQSALSRDSLIENFPIEIPGGDHVVINTSTAPLIYSKGGSILRQIEGVMGAELFQKGIQRYLNSYKYACAKSHHLWEVFEDVSKIPIIEVMKSWIEQPGHPIIDVHRQGRNLTLSQKRFTYLPNNKNQTWKIPISITFYSKNDRVCVKNFLMMGPKMQIELKEKYEAYKLNSDQTGFYRVRYQDESNYDVLLKYVAEKKLMPEDRWGVQLDLFAQVLCGNNSLSEYLNLLSFYSNEDAFLPLISIMDNLFLAYQIVDQQWQGFIAKSGREVTGNILNCIGWDPKADESHTTALLRDHILWPAAIFKLNGITEFTAGKISAMQKGASIHPDIQKSVFQLVALMGNQDMLAWLEKKADASTSEHERLNIYTALGCFDTWEATQAALDLALLKVPARNQFIPITAAAANPHVSRYIWPWYMRNEKQLEQMHPLLYERVVAAIIPSCGLHNKKSVTAFFSDHLTKNDLAADAIRLSLERLEIFDQMRKTHAALDVPYNST